MKTTLQIRIMFAMILVATLSTNSFAHTTVRLFGLSNHPNHELITQDALSTYVPIGILLKNGNPLTFYTPVISFVIDNNVLTDLENEKVQSMHFDQDQFISAQRRLVRQRKAIVRDAATAGGAASAQITLGVALHTIQDFYAHSTWVEQGHAANDLAPLGHEDLANISTGYTEQIPGFLPNSALGSTCDFNGLLNPIKLTSDYFIKAQLIQITGDASTNQPLYTELGFPPNRCIHGAPTFSGPGINKDSAVRGDNFRISRAFAVAASQKFVDEIVSDLGTNTDAVCRLLGREGECRQKQVCYTETFGDSPDSSDFYGTIACYSDATNNFLVSFEVASAYRSSDGRRYGQVLLQYADIKTNQFSEASFSLGDGKFPSAGKRKIFFDDVRAAPFQVDTPYKIQSPVLSYVASDYFKAKSQFYSAGLPYTYTQETSAFVKFSKTDLLVNYLSCYVTSRSDQAFQDRVITTPQFYKFDGGLMLYAVSSPEGGRKVYTGDPPYGEFDSCPTKESTDAVNGIRLENSYFLGKGLLSFTPFQEGF